MIYNAGTLAVSGNTVTGAGTNFTDATNLIRAGQTLVALTSPPQIFQIATVNTSTSLTLTAAANPAIAAGTRYAILTTDALSVDGLAQSIAQLISDYDANSAAWEAFAGTTANQNVTVSINGVSVTIPAIGKLATRGVNGAVPVLQGGTGADNATDARANLGLGEKSAPTFTALELSGLTPFIDFHYNNTTADYNVRLINSADRTLTFVGTGGTGVTVNGISFLQSQYLNVTAPISAAIAQMPGGFLDNAGSRTRLLNQPGASAGGFDLIALNANGTAKCTWNFNVDGGIAGPLGGVTWQSSDQDLKFDVVDPEGGEGAAKARLMQVRPREFSWKYNQKRDRGFIAQEMLAIDERYANFSFSEYDEDNDANDLSGTKGGTYGLSDRAIMADIVTVIQTQQAEIAALKSDLEDLKKIVEDLIAK
ncbi:tail fiber domain-containing protein [Atlantibacter subterraneus]|uniref:tail fiber domain-containing protein n=1 Tax=Atlantibacter subterraneus TaxID=255519 RepID=UPI0029648C88|nr:tail fiber domain-containing protein [Atlantibacter subterranea]MDW2743330.1 tail fiber domain-containing protein [Atlantibacter subterranea]